MRKLIELKEYNGIELKHVWYRENGDVLTYTQAVCERCVRKPAKTVLREDADGNYTVRSRGNAIVTLPSSYVKSLLGRSTESDSTISKSNESSSNEADTQTTRETTEADVSAIDYTKETRAERRARRRANRNK